MENAFEFYSVTVYDGHKHKHLFTGPDILFNFKFRNQDFENFEFFFSILSIFMQNLDVDSKLIF